jgi:sterol desaturase/sphingolipid hydroxylase (fatty acid hydroxylase superfamily)
MTYALASTSGSHSGYLLLGASDHDAHHELFDLNYGVGVFMDKLLKTRVADHPSKMTSFMKKAADRPVTKGE